MAPWGLQELLLRRLDLHLAGANWQRGGGKSSTRPKPIDLPDSKGRGARPSGASPPSSDVVQRLRALGMAPSGSDD